MFTSYSQYEEWYEEAKKRLSNLRKKTVREVELENYHDLVEYYLIAEYCTKPFSEVFYGDVTLEDFQSEVMTLVETKGYLVQDNTDTMIVAGFEGNVSVPETAANVYSYWKQTGAVK